MFRNILAVELSTKLCESFHWCVLQFGDQLHEVNGFSFLSIPHRQAVAILARNTSLSILYKVACVLYSVQYSTVQYSTVLKLETMIMIISSPSSESECEV